MQTIAELLTSTHLLYFHNEKIYKLSNPRKAILFNTKQRTNLLTGETISFDPEELLLLLNSIDYKDNQKNVFALCFYELGEFLKAERLEFEADLFLYIEFDNKEEIDFEFERSRIIFSKVFEESLENYQSKFDEVQYHLNYGDCYQLNLTTEFLYELEGSPADIYSNFLSMPKSEFAHALYIKELDRLILSNSPECLFEISNSTLRTRPIKGTVSEKAGENSLVESSKNETELNIITDLLRNDLSSIGRHFSKVVSAKKIFRVPGLIHQCSVIDVEVDDKVNLLKILKGMFPGGSITGAPKIRVMKLIREIEKRLRGVYTGSSIFFFKGLKKQASINIRTLDICLKSQTCRYGSGGGITLSSDASDEYEELLSKKDSFFDYL